MILLGTSLHALTAFVLAAFVAPAGWAHSTTTDQGVVFDIYRSPVPFNAFTPNINVKTDRLGYDADLIASKKQFAAFNVAPQVDKSVVCSPQTRARFLVWNMTYVTIKLTLTQMIVETRDGTEVLTYTRPAEAPDDPQAITALRSPCAP